MDIDPKAHQLHTVLVPPNELELYVLELEQLGLVVCSMLRLAAAAVSLERVTG